MNRSPNASPPLPRLAPRPPHSHKGDYGRVLLVGGSQGMAGAIALAGMAALRSGAGLVRIATPAVCQPIVAGFEASVMTVGLPADDDGHLASWALPVLAPYIDQADVVACGPGLGRTDSIVEIVAWLYRSVPKPLLVDADGLFALAQRPEALENPGGPRMLTPHEGEFRRLLGQAKLAPEDREPAARRFAERAGAVVVLKGHRTLITDGKRVVDNTTGNPGMATGGTGDVLTGIVTAIVAQHLSPLDAAHLGVHVHGLSGDLAAAELGQVSMIASDLIRYLPHAWRQVEREAAGA